METFVKCFIGFVFTLIFCWIGFMGYMGVKAYQAAPAVMETIEKDGLKSIFNKVWEGNGNGNGTVR